MSSQILLARRKTHWKNSDRVPSWSAQGETRKVPSAAFRGCQDQVRKGGDKERETKVRSCAYVWRGLGRRVRCHEIGRCPCCHDWLPVCGQVDVIVQTDNDGIGCGCVRIHDIDVCSWQIQLQGGDDSASWFAWYYWRCVAGQGPWSTGYCGCSNSRHYLDDAGRDQVIQTKVK